MANAGKLALKADGSFEPGEIKGLIRRAENGDKSTLSELRTLLGDRGACFQQFDIDQLARDALLDSLAGKNLFVRELMVCRMREITAELAGPDPTPIERLLAERAAFCWNVVYAYDRAYAQTEALSIKQADHHQRRIDAAHRRYLSSLKTLATVRRMAVPVLQLNIARNQVNISGEPPSNLRSGSSMSSIPVSAQVKCGEESLMS